ncbi:molybdopterin-dependent oxidoreductase [Puniceibacterium confluentis]|nr:molybdopterin-dependent oxidoreductase [Puniceibacterium confluentis]
MCMALCSGSAAAETLPQPEGQVLLTITGAIESTNHDGSAEFDLAMLRQIGVTAFETATIWNDGRQRFEGVTLAALLAELGVRDGTLNAQAVNNYSIEIPVDEAVPGGPLIAWSRNGKSMSLRDKGPLWLVYPYDTDPAYQSEVTFARSVWQLNRIDVQRP